MKKTFLILQLILISTFASKSFGQKETVFSSNIEKVTLFFQGAQVQHQKTVELKPGRQILVFEKLTDHMDPNSVQVKAKGDLTILSVSTRKNFEDLKMTNSEITELNAKKKTLLQRDEILRDEYAILQNDKNLLSKNSDLKGSQTGLKVSELKDAYSFIHSKLTEIVNRQTILTRELETLAKGINKIEQEIEVRQTKPVTNYSEILVEIDVEKPNTATFDFNYISPKASWTPYYDLRSDGVGKPVRLEAKALVNQSTGIEWKNIDLILSTNDPYQNSKQPEMQEWYLNYNNYPPQKYYGGRTIPVFDYSGQKLRGEVIDASTGEPLPFAKISFYTNTMVTTVTDFDGKFEVIVPKGESYVTASYIGYNSSQLQITAPYLKFFLQPEAVVMYKSPRPAASSSPTQAAGETGDFMNRELSEVTVQSNRSARMSKKDKSYSYAQEYKSEAKNVSKQVAVQVKQKDLRVEYAIQSKLSIPSNGQDQRVQIANYDLPASYEYHGVPKLDPSMYLVAQVTGWENLNLLNGESNLYFDGTYIGKTYIDANSIKDTLSFSLGKDNKLQIERTKIKEKSKNNSIGSRQKVDIAWEIKVKNNGGANIPIVVKDQFPISTNDDIKVKRGELLEGKVGENSGIITWNFSLGQGQSKTLNFNYSVDYKKGSVLYLE